jgi:hypothetical protein
LTILRVIGLGKLLYAIDFKRVIKLNDKEKAENRFRFKVEEFTLILRPQCPWFVKR